ncbi:unnamed protein product [Effrenium voratum]|nr:unnamed protein product [Effrenium voratum]
MVVIEEHRASLELPDGPVDDDGEGSERAENDRSHVEDVMAFLDATAHLDSSSEGVPSPRLPGLERQEQATPAPAKTAPARHSDYLRQALDSLSRAHRALCTITSDVSIENLERLHSVRRSLQEDLEVASSCTVDERLQVVLKLHSQALEDCKLAEEKRETEKPEVIMLRRSIAETIQKAKGLELSARKTATAREGVASATVPVPDVRSWPLQAKELETFLRGPVAPWRLSALHQPTGSLGTTSLLDPEEYRVNRENATAQADKDLAAAMEVHSSTREQLRKSLQEEAQRQKDEEVHFAEELQSLREHLVSRRHSVDTALASQMTEKDLRRDALSPLRSMRRNVCPPHLVLAWIHALQVDFGMRSFDAFARPVQEFQVKTAVGGYISIGAICLVLALFFSELAYFLTPEAKDEMLIDQNQDRKYLNISLDLSLSSMPCSALSLNLLDPKGANVMHVSHEIYKQRISRAGEAIGKPIRDSLQNVATTPTHLAAASLPSRGLRTNHSTTHLRCHSCFQSHIDEDDCCQSCKDVQSSFLERGLDDRPDGYVFGQCAEELYRSHPPLSGESCRLQARLQVRKVPATLHLGVARHFDPSTVQAKLQELTVSADFSHQIQDLSFGPEFPGLVSVLQGRQKSSHRAPLSEHYQYDIHVIPTSYQDGGSEIAGHQYSVTEYVKPVDARNVNNDAAVTGLWLNYDFTPFEVRVTSSRKSLFHFFTECCAILGGIFAFSGLLDNFAHQIHKSLDGKRGMLE